MKTKIDKDFCLSYWSLSYRRKFWRTIWIGAFIPLFFLFPTSYVFIGVVPRNAFVLLIFVSWCIQAVYNYVRWKRDGSEPGAAPNGGPAQRVGNTGTSGGPPSVS
jgi:hypothetical protein